jgi:hypothetical protein
MVKKGKIENIKIKLCALPQSKSDKIEAIVSKYIFFIMLAGKNFNQEYSNFSSIVTGFVDESVFIVWKSREPKAGRRRKMKKR